MTMTMDRPGNVAFDERASRRVREDEHYSKSTGLFPAGALSTPMLEGKDVAGLVAAVAITLGPLAAYSLGLGA